MPEKVEEKIRYLLRKYPSTEWSGVLFYSYQGGFESGDLVITCEDLFPMDLGTTGSTEFRMTPEVSRYVAHNIELFDCQTGLVHSHHQLGAFFSATDLSTLQAEGNDTNCFVSLVVDTRGTYVAAITRKIKTKRTVTITDNETSYNFFGEGSKNLSAPSTVTKEVENEEIQYFSLDVERHEVSNPLDFLDQRFKEILDKKNPPSKPSSPVSYNLFNDRPFTHYPINDCALPWWKESEEEFSEQSKTFYADGDSEEETFEHNYSPDKDLIHAAVCKMIMCSLTFSASKFDLKQWVMRHMNNIYGKVFPNMNAFQDWADFVVPFYVYNFVDPSAPKDLPDESYFGTVIEAMVKEIMPLRHTDTPFIQKYIETLENYLI